MALFFTEKQEKYKRYKLHKILRDNGIEFNPWKRTIKIPKGSSLGNLDAVIELIGLFNYHIES